MSISDSMDAQDLPPFSDDNYEEAIAAQLWVDVYKLYLEKNYLSSSAHITSAHEADIAVTKFNKRPK